MTPTILDSDYATRIRNRLGISESVLSTGEIDEKLSDLEDDYIDLLPTWASKTSLEQKRFKSSLVCKCASDLCSVVKAKYATKETGPNGSFETPINWDLKSKELETEANRLLSLVIPVVIYPHFQIR